MCVGDGVLDHHRTANRAHPQQAIARCRNNKGLLDSTPKTTQNCIPRAGLPQRHRPQQHNFDRRAAAREMDDDDLAARVAEQRRLGEAEGVARSADVALESDTALCHRKCDNATCLQRDRVGGVALRRCSACRQRWFCSRHCQVGKCERGLLRASKSQGEAHTPLAATAHTAAAAAACNTQHTRRRRGATATRASASSFDAPTTTRSQSKSLLSLFYLSVSQSKRMCVCGQRRRGPFSAPKSGRGRSKK
jgi:hypothetical protein